MRQQVLEHAGAAAPEPVDDFVVFQWLRIQCLPAAFAAQLFQAFFAVGDEPARFFRMRGLQTQQALGKQARRVIAFGQLVQRDLRAGLGDDLFNKVVRARGLAFMQELAQVVFQT